MTKGSADEYYGKGASRERPMFVIATDHINKGPKFRSIMGYFKHGITEDAEEVENEPIFHRVKAKLDHEPVLSIALNAT